MRSSRLPDPATKASKSSASREPADASSSRVARPAHDLVHPRLHTYGDAGAAGRGCPGPVTGCGRRGCRRRRAPRTGRKAPRRTTRPRPCGGPPRRAAAGGSANSVSAAADSHRLNVPCRPIGASPMPTASRRPAAAVQVGRHRRHRPPEGDHPAGPDPGPGQGGHRTVVRRVGLGVPNGSPAGPPAPARQRPAARRAAARPAIRPQPRATGPASKASAASAALSQVASSPQRCGRRRVP